MKHIFYKTENLTLEERIDIIEYAKEKSYKWRVDILDCNVSFAREEIKMSYDDIMAKFNLECHFVVISRYDIFKKEYYGEVGFCTLKTPEYFLWVYIENGVFSELIQKFKLEKR